MAKTAVINCRIEASLKRDAEDIMKQLGVKPANMITLLYRQITLKRNIPFEIKFPDETKERMNLEKTLNNVIRLTGFSAKRAAKILDIDQSTLSNLSLFPTEKLWEFLLTLEKYLEPNEETQKALRRPLDDKEVKVYGSVEDAIKDSQNW